VNKYSATKRKAVDEFWSTQPPCTHCLQLYDSDAALLDALEGFIATGIRQGDAIVVIATPSHRTELDRRLAYAGFDPAAAAERGQYLPLDAAELLAQFTDDGVPDEARFRRVIGDLLVRARRHYPSVRAFGEMVGLLWADGHYASTARLEEMWSRVCHDNDLALFCAYPKAGFDAAPAFAAQIEAAHSQACPF